MAGETKLYYAVMLKEIDKLSENALSRILGYVNGHTFASQVGAELSQLNALHELTRDIALRLLELWTAEETLKEEAPVNGYLH